jgi:hypothetical protein
MSIKIIADSKDEFPEHLRSQAEETDGKFQIDANGLINKNKELLKDLSKLNSKIETLTADKETAVAERDEWKGKAKIPSGHKIVAADVAELGEAAKQANLVKDELPALKTKADELQAKLAERDAEAINAKVAEASGKDPQAWREHAAANRLRYEPRKEKIGDEEQEFFVVFRPGDDGKETEAKLADYLTANAAHVKDAQERKSGVQYPVQMSAKKNLTPPNLAAELMKKRYTGVGASKKD